MSLTAFDQRVTRLEEKHRRLSVGVTYRIGPDGLITAHPHRRYLPRFPVRGLLLLLVAGFAFKALLFTASGEATYNGRLAELAGGSAVERAAAWAMQPDVATRAVAALAATIASAAEADLP